MNTFSVAISFVFKSLIPFVLTALDKTTMKNSVSFANRILDLFSVSANVWQPSSHKRPTKEVVFNNSCTESFKFVSLH